MWGFFLVEKLLYIFNAIDIKGTVFHFGYAASQYQTVETELAIFLPGSMYTIDDFNHCDYVDARRIRDLHNIQRHAKSPPINQKILAQL